MPAARRWQAGRGVPAPAGHDRPGSGPGRAGRADGAARDAGTGVSSTVLRHHAARRPVLGRPGRATPDVLPPAMRPAGTASAGRRPSWAKSPGCWRAAPWSPHSARTGRWRWTRCPSACPPGSWPAGCARGLALPQSGAGARPARRRLRSPGQASAPSLAARRCGSWCCSAGWQASPWCPRGWPRRMPARWVAGRPRSAC